MKKTKKLIMLITMFAVIGAITASAQLSIDAIDVQSLITFDADIAGTYQTNSHATEIGSVTEPGGWRRNEWNAAKPALFFSEAVVSYGRISTSVQFGDDGNNDGDTGDENIGGNDVRVRYPATTSLADNALQMSTDDIYAYSGFYIRIQNNTGATVNNWNFMVDIRYGDAVANGDVSVLELSYAVDDGITPSNMTFTVFGTPPAVVDGVSVITDLAGTVNETVDAQVTNGGYIVWYFEDATPSPSWNPAGPGPGSDVYLDNIGVTAVAPPPSGALISVH